jgi:hypothetical protein
VSCCRRSDGSSIAFVADGRLKKVSVRGGTPVTLADAPNGQGITWNRDGTIVFAPSPNDALLRVADAGGTPVPVTRLSPGDLGHVFPQFLPDGRHFVYFVRGPVPRKGIYAGSIDSLEGKHLRLTREKALYAAQGYLLFLEDGRLLAQSFDADGLDRCCAANPYVAEHPVGQVKLDDADRAPRRLHGRSPRNSTISVRVVARAMARRAPSRDQAKSRICRPSVKCVN